MSFRFRMYLADGEDLDDYTSSEPNWSAGDVVYGGGLPAYRITAVIDAGIWEVEPIGAPASNPWRPRSA